MGYPPDREWEAKEEEERETEGHPPMENGKPMKKMNRS